MTIKEYRFEPLERSLTILLPDDRGLRLPRGTVYVGVQIFDDHLDVYRRTKPDSGSGNLKFPVEFLGDLEKELDKLPVKHVQKPFPLR